jgi:ribonuclease HII
MTVRQKTIVRGDACCVSIAAASIMAKVHRDRLMTLLDDKYPGYGFAVHKGYGTASHLKALAELGPSPAHRRSFAPVARHLREADDLFRQ